MTINDGGPAFPVMRENEAGFLFMAAPGMTLRDYFAAAALTGMLIGKNWDFSMLEQDPGIKAYRFADSALKAREAQHG